VELYVNFEYEPDGITQVNPTARIKIANKIVNADGKLNVFFFLDASIASSLCLTFKARLIKTLVKPTALFTLRMASQSSFII